MASTTELHTAHRADLQSLLDQFDSLAASAAGDELHKSARLEVIKNATANLRTQVDLLTDVNGPATAGGDAQARIAELERALADARSAGPVTVSDNAQGA